jgi:Tfp pilus assembly ATPase PilU
MVRAMLSESLIGVISQTLCKTKDGSGRVAAHEIMLGTAAIRNLIRETKIAQMYSAIQTGNTIGMQTLDQNLADLVRRNIISAPEARSKAKFPENFPADRKETAMERDQASKFVNDLLRLMVSRNGSDLFLTADFPPAIKVDGKVTKVSPQPLSGQHTLALTRSIMNDKQAAEFERTKECNFAVAPQGIGRFRVNAFVQQGNVGLVMRTIPQTIPTIDSMNLPHVLKDVAMTKRGLVIFVGATGSGKSTSLAAMVDHRNENSFGHIITIEDPIEFVHPHKNCIVTQREVGIDTDGWACALKNTLRQART